MCNHLYNKLVAAKAGQLYGVFDMFPDEIQVDVTREPANINAHLSHEYHLCYLDEEDVNLGPQQFVDQVLRRQVKALCSGLAFNIWRSYHPGRHLLVTLRPPQETSRPSILLEGSLPARWSVDRDMDGRAISLVEVFMGMKVLIDG